MSKSVLLVIFVLLLEACATKIEPKRALDVGMRESLVITDVAVNALPEAGAKPILLTNLRNAVLIELGAVKTQGNIGRLELMVTKAQLVSTARRAFIGFLAGFDILYVTATIKDGKSLAVIAEFEIKGEYNPGGLGMFTNPKIYTVKRVAEALVEVIYQIK